MVLLALADLNRRTSDDHYRFSLAHDAHKRRKLADHATSNGVVPYENYSTLSFENRRMNGEIEQNRLSSNVVPKFENFRGSLDIGNPTSSRFISGKPQAEVDEGIKRPGILFGATLRAPQTEGFQIKLAIPSLPKLDLNLGGKDISE